MRENKIIDVFMGFDGCDIWYDKTDNEGESEISPIMLEHIEVGQSTDKKYIMLIGDENLTLKIKKEKIKSIDDAFSEDIRVYLNSGNCIHIEMVN